MIQYMLRRVLLIVPVLLGVSILLFLMLHLIPGDPARILAGMDATPELIEALRRDLGLNDPLPVQYMRFLNHSIHGDLGYSYVTREPVMEQLVPRFRATLQLATAGLLIALIIGVPAGIIAAIRRQTVIDNVAMVFALLGISMPTFWLALLLILLFSVELRWLPSAGRGGWQHLILPAIALSTWSTSIISRMTRASMLEVMNQDYIRVARAKGLHERLVILRHALRNAFIPILTVIGLRFGYMLGGAVITETVFSWPGLGRFIVISLQARDFPNIRGAILLFALSFIIVNLIVDILYAAFDPRIRYA